MKTPLRIGICQFNVEGDVDQNRRAILKQIGQAARQGARIVHFSEAALSGYAGFDIPHTSAIDWDSLRLATEAICQRAARCGVWVVLGSTHRLSDGHRPHNSLYAISPEGHVVERYDKRFCTGIVEPGPTLDQAYYTPGDHATVLDIDGWRVGLLICYDYRFPELYRDLKRRGVEVVLHSFHNARHSQRVYEEENIWKDIVPATLMCHAATNHMWISATNSTTRYSLWPSFFVRPDGLVVSRLRAHRPGVMIGEVNPSLELWDAPGPWRKRAMAGTLHSGTTVDDPRSRDRCCY